jgi:multiple sugar transport system substrate-binding protein
MGFEHGASDVGRSDGDACRARRLSRRALLRGAAGLGALTALSGILAACGQQSQPASPAATSAPAAKPTEAVKPAAPAAAGQSTTAPAATTAPAGGAAQPTAAAAEPAQKPAQGAVEMRFAWWGSQDRHDRTIKAIQLFEQKNPNITMSYEFAGFQDYFTKMTTQASGGNLPDLMQQDYAYVSQWVANNLLVDLDDFVNSKAIDLSTTAKNTVDGGRIDGKLYAVNLGSNSQCMVLDTAAFEKAGVQLPSDTWTWQDFEKTATDLHGKLGYYGAGPSLSDIQLWKSLYLGYGKWGFSKDGKALGYDDDQPFIDYLKMLLRLQDAQAIPNDQDEIAQWRTASIEARPIVQSKSAIDYMWSNQLVAVWTAAGADRKLKLAPLPRPQGGQPENYFKPSQFISITSQSKHQPEAAKFVNFITNDIDANKILLGERGVPIAPAVLEAIKPLSTPSQTEVLNYMSALEKNSSPLPPPDPPSQSKLNDNVYLPQLIDPVLLGKAKPEDAVAQFRKDATDLLKSS